jgi:putative ABC transport system permease protein
MTMHRLIQLFDSLFRRQRVEADVDEELRNSFEMIVDRLVDQGMPPADARRAARLEFDGVEQVKEKVRDNLFGASLHGRLQDIRQGWRGLRRRPGFAMVAIVTLSLGVGVTTAMLSGFYAVILKPLPYPHPEQLVLIWAGFRGAGTNRAPASGAILGEMAHRNRSLSGVGGIWSLTRIFTGNEPEQVRHARVTTNFFDVLGVRATLGRSFVSADGGTNTVMLADGIFRRRFGTDPSVIGRSILLDDRGNTVAGVLPPGSRLYFAPDANIPADIQSFDAFNDRIWGQRGGVFHPRCRSPQARCIA